MPFGGHSLVFGNGARLVSSRSGHRSRKALECSLANCGCRRAAEWDTPRSEPSWFSMGCQKLRCAPIQSVELQFALKITQPPVVSASFDLGEPMAYGIE